MDEKMREETEVDESLLKRKKVTIKLNDSVAEDLRNQKEKSEIKAQAEKELRAKIDAAKIKLKEENK